MNDQDLIGRLHDIDNFTGAGSVAEAKIRILVTELEQPMNAGRSYCEPAPLPLDKLELLARLEQISDSIKAYHVLCGPLYRLIADVKATPDVAPAEPEDEPEGDGDYPEASIEQDNIPPSLSIFVSTDHSGLYSASITGRHADKYIVSGLDGEMSSIVGLLEALPDGASVSVTVPFAG